MRYIVQTAVEMSQVDRETGRARLILSDKVTIPCQSHKEASEIADGFNSIPGRRAWAGVEHYSEGGVKLLLSFADVHGLSRLAKELPNVPTPRFELAAD